MQQQDGQHVCSFPQLYGLHQDIWYTISLIALRETDRNTSVYSQVTEHIILVYSIEYQTFYHINQFIRCSLYQSIKKLNNIYEQSIQQQVVQGLVQDECGERYTSFSHDSKFLYRNFHYTHNSSQGLYPSQSRG